MSGLRVLSAAMANMIAAGEVVQRPSSVVKELMENAVDAGATRISVIIKDAGRTLIQVIDDGSGMNSADALLCFERHATSKVHQPEDLSAIATYGFRGEALASIAAVADVTLKTRQEGDETGTQVHIAAGEANCSSVAAPKGSNFAVRNLFFNTPARRKFLKSDAAEFRHIVEEFTRVALTRPELGFTLSRDGKDVYVLKPAKSVKFRILDLLGAAAADEVADFDVKTSYLTLSGYVGRPESARKVQGNQFFFVNGRYFRSPYLHKAVMNAYEGLLPEGATPAYFIYLDMAPDQVDVNVHPSKIDVKFAEESVVFQTVYASVKEAVGRYAFGDSIDFSMEDAQPLPQIGEAFSAYKGPAVAPSADFDPAYNPFEPAKSPGMVRERVAQDYGALFEEKALPAPQALVLQGKYILSLTASGLMIVHVRRAWERILYERALRALEGRERVTQTALFPVQVRLTAGQALLFEQHAEPLAALGFDITPFGAGTVLVNGVPEGYSCEEGRVQRMVEDLVLILSDSREGQLPELLRGAMAEKIATLESLGKGDIRTPEEAARLLDALFATSNAEQTPGGKRTLTLVKTEDIDKKF
ncbi:MAG: DNA mismatch repair endonuclease MutL [Bacteroidales bacterium]|nr:DNA mismatch repair endonuclease MutL [Bacteroidales bacterium]